MSRFDYEQSRRIALSDPPFRALIMAAMRRADSDNLKRLQVAFPDVWRELEVRYNTPGGRLLTDAAQGWRDPTQTGY